MFDHTLACVWSHGFVFGHMGLCLITWYSGHMLSCPHGHKVVHMYRWYLVVGSQVVATLSLCIYGSHVVIMYLWQPCGYYVSMAAMWLLCIYGSHVVIMYLWQPCGYYVSMAAMWLLCIYGSHVVIMYLWQPCGYYVSMAAMWLLCIYGSHVVIMYLWQPCGYYVSMAAMWLLCLWYLQSKLHVLLDFMNKPISLVMVRILTSYAHRHMERSTR